MGTGEKGIKEYLTLPLSPPTAAASSPSLLFISPPLPSPPGWACQSWERQSDMSLAAGYQGLIKGGWQCRMEPIQGGSALLDESRLSLIFAECCLWLEVISCIIREVAQKSLSTQPRVGTLFMTLLPQPLKEPNGGQCSEKKSMTSCTSWFIHLYLSRKTGVSFFISTTLIHSHTELPSHDDVLLLKSGVRGQ